VKQFFNFIPSPSSHTRQHAVSPPIPIGGRPPVTSSRMYEYFSHWSFLSWSCVWNSFFCTTVSFFSTLLMIYTKWKGYLYIGKGFIRLSRSTPRCEKKTRLHYVSSNDLWAWCPADRQWFDVIDRVCDDDNDTTVSNH